MNSKARFLILLLPSLSACKPESENFVFVPAQVDCTSKAEVADLATIDTSSTPRANRTAEILALEVSGEFIAPQGLYQRVDAELTGLMAADPSLSQSAGSCLSGGITIRFDDAIYGEVHSGTYDAWDTLNKNLRGTVDVSISNSATLTFDGRFNVNNVMDAYALLPGVESVLPNGTHGGSSDICLAEYEGFHFYIFAQGSGDCPAGCINREYDGYEVDASGNIRRLGKYRKGDPAPDWFESLEACRVFLEL